MSNIKKVEDAMITAAKLAMQNGNKSHVRTIETIPGGWTQQTLTRMLNDAPGIYISFLGGTPPNDYDQVLTLSARFDAVIINESQREEERRRGTKSQIGAYEMLELLTPLLNGLLIPDVGTLKVTQVRNLFSEFSFERGATIYGIQCAVPNMSFALSDNSELDDFETFNVDYDIPTFENLEERQEWLQNNYANSIPDASDNVQLEQ